jgi:hypothetical protein
MDAEKVPDRFLHAIIKKMILIPVIFHNYVNKSVHVLNVRTEKMTKKFDSSETTSNLIRIEYCSLKVTVYNTIVKYGKFLHLHILPKFNIYLYIL